MNMKYGVAVILMLGVLSVQAGDALKGKGSAALCAGCHGSAGVTNNGNNPNLAGQNEAYFVKALKAYRDGGRKDRMMGMVSKSLSDEDIENLAAYYKGIK